MRPLSDLVPKALLPLWGVPVLEHVIRMLVRWGVSDILVNCHHRAEEIVDFVRRRRDRDVALSLSFEPRILGTGGALRQAEWFLQDDPFWMINADVAADLDPGPLVRAMSRPKTLAALWLVPDRGPRTVETRQDRVMTFRSRNPGAAGRSTFSGLHLISPRILSFIPDGYSSIITSYETAMRDGWVIRGLTVPDSYWADMGTPEQIVDAHREVLRRYRAKQPGRTLMNSELLARQRDLRRRGFRIEGFAAVDSRATVRAGAHLIDAVVMEQADVGRSAEMSRGILGPRAVLRGPSSRLVLRASDVLNERERRFARRHVGPLDSMTAECLAHRGSERTFTRLRSGTKTAILIRYSPERTENRLYASHARFLRRVQFPVPRVLEDDPARAVTLLEDAGSVSLQDFVHEASTVRAMRAYRIILDHVHRLHRRATDAARQEKIELMEPFAAALLRSERDLFQRHFLSARIGASQQERENAMRDLRRVSRRLSGLDPVLLHRDLQSSNVYLRRRGPLFIDFQGMRLGPAAYDVASLLCDPYVFLPERAQQELRSYYAAKDEQAARDMQVFWWAAIQRLAQALGAFGRLSTLSGGASFALHVPPALRMMSRAIRNVDPPLPALRNVIESGIGRPPRRHVTPDPR